MERVEDKIEDIVEKKVEERVKRRLDERQNEIEERIEEKVAERVEKELSWGKRDGTAKENVSRRSFLKKIGAGAAGLGAMGIASASGLKLTESGVFDSGYKSGVLTDSGTDSDSGNNYQLPNSVDNIDMQDSGDLKNVENVDTGSLTVDQHPSDEHWAIIDSGSFTGSFDSTISLSDYRRYKVEFINCRASYDGVRAQMYFNSDNSSSNYQGSYINGSNVSSSTGQNVLDLFTSRDYNRGGGEIIIQPRGKTTIAASLASPRINKTLLQGYHDNSTDLNSLSLTTDGDWDGFNYVVKGAN